MGVESQKWEQKQEIDHTEALTIVTKKARKAISKSELERLSVNVDPKTLPYDQLVQKPT